MLCWLGNMKSSVRVSHTGCGDVYCQNHTAGEMCLYVLGFSVVRFPEWPKSPGEWSDAVINAVIQQIWRERCGVHGHRSLFVSADATRWCHRWRGGGGGGGGSRRSPLHPQASLSSSSLLPPSPHRVMTLRMSGGVTQQQRRQRDRCGMSCGACASQRRTVHRFRSKPPPPPPVVTGQADDIKNAQWRRSALATRVRLQHPCAVSCTAPFVLYSIPPPPPSCTALLFSLAIPCLNYLDACVRVIVGVCWLGRGGGVRGWLSQA